MKNRTTTYLYTGLVLSVIILSHSFMVCVSSHASERRERVKWTRVRGGLGTLQSLSKARDEMLSDYQDETENYESVLKGIDTGILEKGMSSGRIADEYGEAVLVMPEENRQRTRWVYKPAKSDYFKGPKIYLFFDQEDQLETWERVN